MFGRIGNTNQFTVMSRNGTSVIDYLLCSERHFSMINDFTFGQFNEGSDHAPLQFSLICNNVSRNDASYSEVRYKWNANYKI